MTISNSIRRLSKWEKWQFQGILSRQVKTCHNILKTKHGQIGVTGLWRPLWPDNIPAPSTAGARLGDEYRD
jgi:hypothetical protein